MLKNYLKIAWRNLLQNKGLSFINIFGLAIGMTFSILIALWINYETSFDNFHVNKDRIALVMKHSLRNGEKATGSSIPLPLYKELKANYPEVKRATRMDWGNNHSLVVSDKRLNKSGLYVDPDFLKMFTFPLIKGNIDKALSDPNSVVLSETLAQQLFGSGNPIGKLIKLDNQFDVMVSGVIQDAPKNSSLNFEFLAPFEFKILNDESVKNSQDQWDNSFLLNAIELKEGVDMDVFSKKIQLLLPNKDRTIKNRFLFLQPLDRWHLRNNFKDWVNTGGKNETVNLFGIIGVFILLIACINFMNLSTARSEKRAKEVGIRKSVGSKRKQLIAQFLTESTFTAFISFLFSLILVKLTLPLLKDLGFEHVKFDLTDVSVVNFVLCICIITGLVAGSYPAFYLSSFRPVKVLKGTVSQGRGTVTFRKVLVVFQFAISTGLIIITLVIAQQTNHARSRSIGYDPDNLISVEASSDLAKNYDVLKQELLNTGMLEAVSKSSSTMTNIFNDWNGFSWDGMDPNLDPGMSVIMTEYDYEKVTRTKFKGGRAFSREFKTDPDAVILNEAAAKLIGFKNPVGKTIKHSGKSLEIIGVTENVVINSPFREVRPAVILFRKDNTVTILLRVKAKTDLRQTLDAIKPIFERHNPALPFEYKFADEEFGRKFNDVNQVSKLAAIFAGQTVLISCLGLFGLAAFMAERRRKEIGIRKVLGASISDLWILLSGQFILLVLIACSIASPIAFVLTESWLSLFEYRITISIGMFVVVAISALLIAVGTVSFQVIRVALANPVKGLRTE